MRSTRRQKSLSSNKVGSKSVTRRQVIKIKQPQQRNDQASSDEEEKSSRRPARNRSMSRAKSSHNDTSVYKKGTYVAFVDASDMENFKIGLLLNDLNEDEEEALLDIFQLMAPLVYQKQASKQTVPEYAIICDIEVTLEKVTKKGAKPQLKITKQANNKAAKLMDLVVKLVQDGQDEENSDEEEDDSEDDEESEEQEESELQKDDISTIKGRRMIKGRSSVKPVATQSKSKKRAQSSAKSVKSAKPQEKPKKPVTAQKGKSKTSSKSPSKRVPPKKAATAKDDDMEDESKEEEESEEVVMIDTSKKRSTAAAGRSQQKKKAATLPQVGVKRIRPTKKQEVDESHESSFVEATQNQDEGSFDEDEDSRVVKKRKVGKGQEKVLKPKSKKAAKKPIVFKKGTWNPDIQLVDTDKYKESDSNDLYFDCCIRCNNKNIIRAAITQNDKLLKKGIDAKKKISSLTAYWSPEVKWSALEYMISQNLHNQLEILMHPKLTKAIPAHSSYEFERDLTFNERVNNPAYLMNVVKTGMVSHMAYGARVRKVQMTRGNRQGDNAFLEYQDNNQRNPVYYTNDQYILRRMLYTESVEYETFQQIYKLNPNIESYLQTYAYDAVRAGNRKIAFELIKNMAKYPNFGFNQLHVDMLSTDAPQPEKILKQSTTKKANTNKDITPMHCACINPNPKYLKMLLDVNPELAVADQDLRKLVHYAAANEGPEPLEILIQAGASLIDLDNQKINCLHVAAMTGRAHNARTILQSAPKLLNQRDKKSMTPMAYACKFGHTEVVKVLLEFKVKINVGCGLERMPPLSWASAYGHYDLVKFLLDNKGRTLGKDKYKRTPLIMAVRNGHTKIASLLLQKGSEWNHPDSSNNTPLHFAAAYGSLDSIELLLKAGADLNAQNSWKNSPINIAMLKNHQGCVKRLLEEPNVDVNGKDEKGRTLLMLSLYVLDEESEDFISFLLRKGADPNIADLEGETALHYIAKYQPQAQQLANGQPNKAAYLQQVEFQKKATQLLIQNGADLTIKDNQKRTPFAICLENDNAPLLEFLKDRVSINKEPEILFAFKDKIFNIEYQKILERLILNDPPLKETINILDDQGFTPFLRFVKSFAEKYNEIFTNVQNRINQQSFHHADNTANYKITNADLFDKFADQTNFYTYNYNFNQEMKNVLTRKFLDEIIAQPFVKILKFLISQGADEHAIVVKTKKYRDLEILKQQQIQIYAQGAANGQQIVNALKEEKIKKREEKLKEMRKRKMNNMQGKAPRMKITMYGGGFAQPAADQEEVEVFDKIDGKKVLREYNIEGKRNAIHLLIKVPQQTIFGFLLSLKINPDHPDYDELTPFNLMSSDGANRYDSMFKEAFDKLLDLEVRVDYPDTKGRTPFLNYYDQQNFEIAYRMLDMGANVNQMDTSGLFALKYALIRRHNSKIQELLDRDANINQIDNKGRNLLHHAINMSSATADATFETEQFLIERGVEINHLDNKHRTPLHYAFVKIQGWQQTSQIDPIETVSSICGCKGLQLDIPDKWLKTPLHYASQRGASICAMYLIQRGADIERTDIYGNTALGVGLMNGHYNYGIILIQKMASVKPLIHKEDPERIKKQWEEEEKQKKLLYRTQSKTGSKPKVNGGDAEMEEEEEKEEQSKKKKGKHRNMFNNRNQGLNNDYYGEEDYGEEDYDEEIDEQDYYQEQVFNQQNAFGMNVYNNQRRKAPAYANFGGGFGSQPQYNQFGSNNNNDPNNALISKEDKEGVSMFKISIRGGQQGLAYLMLDNGYDLMLAMQDAMDEKKFMLVLTLLSKNPNDEVVQQKNNKGQNLFHILSMNASSCSLEHLQRIYEALLKRGVDVKAKDNFGRNALHYAVIGGSIALVKLLLISGNGYNPNEVDKDGFTPLSLCLKGKGSDTLYYNPTHPIDNIFLTLVKAGADVNFVYPEETFKPWFKEEDLDEDQLGNYDPKGKYQSSVLINLIRQNSKNEVMRNNLIGLIEYGAKLNVQDSDGRDPIMHAIISNNIMVLTILLENKRALNVNPQCQDIAKKSAAHYVVNPLRFGSFENVDILKLLHKFNFNLQLKDSQGKSPAAYAAEQQSGVMIKELAKLTRQEEQLNNYKRAQSMVDSQRWPELKVDFEQDAEQYMDLAHEKEKQLAKEKEFRIPVDTTGNFEKSYTVYYDQNDHPWDCYLTKVDLKNGIYGDYVFYKMQLLYDSNRDLYVVFTRWGRIGEPGMNQRTPFNNLDEAKGDYKKIFKQKSGGNNFEELDTFSRVKKKYNITRVNYITVNYKDYLQPFDFDKCPKTKLSKPLYQLFEEVANVTMYQRAMNMFGLDTDVLPFSGVKKESLVEARQVLMEIQEALTEDQNISKEGIKANYDALVAVKERICELSSRYYELIPLARFKDQIAPPLNYAHLIKAQYDIIDGLTNIEYASKMLLAALLRQQDMNPIDYVYQALNLLIEPLDNESGEYEVLKRYIDQTQQSDEYNPNVNYYEIANIFKFQRKGEAEMIQAFKDVPNHFLLFHGSAMFNFIGILSQGLRVAPPEAPPTGYMFGKGVYFADMFGKSFAYAQRGYAAQDSYLMLMCEVVLGKSKELYAGEYIEKLEHPYSSVKGLGRRGPGYKNTVICPNGVKVPYGQVINYHEKNPELQKKLMLQHNEYIVYNTPQIRMRYLIQVQKKDLKKNK